MLEGEVDDERRPPVIEVESRILVDEQPTAVVRGCMRMADVPRWLARTYPVVLAHLDRCDLEPAGPPFARFHPNGAGEYDLEAGYPLREPIEDEPPVVASFLPAGPAAIAWHDDPFGDMTAAYTALRRFVDEHGGVPGDAWEIYHAAPGGIADLLWRTEIVMPLRQRQSGLLPGDDPAVEVVDLGEPLVG